MKTPFFQDHFVRSQLLYREIKFKSKHTKKQAERQTKKDICIKHKHKTSEEVYVCQKCQQNVYNDKILYGKRIREKTDVCMSKGSDKYCVFFSPVTEMFQLIRSSGGRGKLSNKKDKQTNKMGECIQET